MAQPPGPTDPTQPPSTPHGTAYPGPGAYHGPNAGQTPPPHPQQTYGHPQQTYGHAQQGYGHPQQGYPPPGYGYPPRVPMTPDGAVLSGWWRRVGARIVDGLIITVVSLPLTGYFIYKYIGLYWDATMDQLESGAGSSTAALSWDIQKWLLPALLINLVVSLGYEYFFVTRSGATPGKRVADISIRLRDIPGPPPGEAVLKRWGLYAGLGLITNIPLVGNYLGLIPLLNYLWPLWDSNRQAWHDKVAATNVVRGPQPPR